MTETFGWDEMVKQAQEGGQELELLPAGTYQLQFSNVKARPTDIMPTYVVVSGPYQGKRVMAGTFGSLKGGGKGIALQLWKRAGLDDATLKSIYDQVGGNVAAMIASVAALLKDRVIEAGLTQEPVPGSGEIRNKMTINTVKYLGGGATAGPAPVAVAPAPAAPVAPVAAPAPVAAAPVAPTPAPPAVAAQPVAVAPVAAAAPPQPAPAAEITVTQEPAF